jgi:hypothetical protein
MKIGQKISKDHMPKGKNSRQEFLPNRHALSKLTNGTPWERNTLNYAKATPSGASAPGKYHDIMMMGVLGIDGKK